MDDLEELNLLKRAANGDGEAFSALLEEYYMTIYKIAYKWCGNKTDAEDTTQEVCIKLGQSIKNFRADSKFSSWLYRIVINTATDLVRKKKNHVDIQEMTEAISSDDKSQEEVIEEQQLWSNVHKLADKKRDAVLLVYSEGLSHAEVAEIMECKESTVSWYIHEAKDELKNLVGNDGR